MATVNIIVTATPATTVTVNDGDMVVIRFTGDATPSLLQEACEAFVNAIRRLGVEVSCIAIGPQFYQPTVEVFSAVHMRQMGWVRVGEDPAG